MGQEDEHARDKEGAQLASLLLQKRVGGGEKTVLGWENLCHRTEKKSIGTCRPDLLFVHNKHPHTHNKRTKGNGEEDRNWGAGGRGGVCSVLFQEDAFGERGELTEDVQKGGLKRRFRRDK